MTFIQDNPTMAKQLAPYHGELLLVPWALELSLIEPCDYACAYCFAILNDRGRKHYTNSTTEHAQGVKQALNLISTAHQRKTLEAYYINNRYPVLMSNRTDPFGRKNRVQSMAFLELFHDLGIPVAFQTKGFIKHEPDFEKVMSLTRPSWWYITIAQDNDELRQRIEPGATSIDYRFELIRELTDRGHVVCVGWNPFCPEWVSDPEAFLQRMVDAGANQVAIQMLHLNSSNRNQMTTREIERLSGGDMEWFKTFAGKRSAPEPWVQAIREAHVLAYEMGLNICGRDAGWAHDVWGDVNPLYEKRLPTVADFLWHCSQTKSEGDPVTFAEWRDWCMELLPPITAGIGHALRIKSWMLCDRIVKDKKWAKWKTTMGYEELLRLGWEYSHKVADLSPMICSAFCPMLDANEKPVLDDEGLQVLAYAPPPDNPLDQYAGWLSA